RLRGVDAEPIRLLVLEPQPAVALVPDGDRLRPPARDGVLPHQEGCGLLVGAAAAAPPVEDREPRVPPPAGRGLDPLVGRALIRHHQPRLCGPDPVALTDHLGTRGGVALAGLGHALAHPALERLLAGHRTLLRHAATAGLTLPTARHEGVRPHIPRTGSPLPRC